MAATKKNTKSSIPSKRVPFTLSEKNTIHATLFRYNPSMDFIPRTHTYSLEKKEGESVWELLQRIKHHHDGSLTFRGNCGNGACGGCGIKVNGKPVMGCTTQVSGVMGENNSLTIAPLDEQRVKKDLASDESLFFSQLLAAKPWIESRASEHARRNKMSQKEAELLGRAQECNLCQLCNANAKVDLEKELGPAAFVKGYRYARDMRDGDVSRVEMLKTHLPVHYSLEKANLCPRDILPGEKIEWIKKQKPILPPTKKKKRGK